MDRLTFDIETNGFLPELTTVHCIAALDAEGEALLYHDRADLAERTGSIRDGLDRLGAAELLVGHNIDSFDIPALQKLYPKFRPRASFDTIVAARLIWPEIRESDMMEVRGGRLPSNLIGWQSLEAWGYRLGLRKGEYGKTSDWSAFSKPMLDYCLQDARVTEKLYRKIDRLNYSPAAFELEHEFSRVLNRQMEHGIIFDDAKARTLIAELLQARIALDTKLKATIPPFVDTYVTPKKKIEKTKEIAFNPNSRDHIARHLIDRREWTPEEYTDSGKKPKIDENVLKGLLHWPEAKLFMERFLIQKRLGQLDEGAKGWTKLVDPNTGRIHGRITHNGAVTGRCTHSNPNLSAVPKVKSKGGKVLMGAEGEYGYECRSLFTVPPGFKMVGADAAGIELRMLAHYMARYDDGEYVKVVTEGDPHETNRIAAGLETRDQAKTFIYAWLYGAGDTKIGSILGAGPAAGRALRERFLQQLPALAKVKEAVAKAFQDRGAIKGLDGRALMIRSQHSALNTALQGAAAVAMKKATVLLDQYIEHFGVREHAHQVLFVHDEFQIEVREPYAEKIGQLAVQAIRDAGAAFNLRCPLDGEYKVGRSWAETH